MIRTYLTLIFWDFTFGGLLDFIDGWLKSRRWRAIAVGAPALLSIVGLFAFLYCSHDNSVNVADRAMVAATREISQESWNAAEFSLKRVLSRRPNDPAALYYLGIAHEQLGRPALASALMTRVSESLSPYAGAAAVWRVTQPGAVDPETGIPHDKLIPLLKLASSYAPQDVVIRHALAKSLLIAGQWEQGIFHYSHAAQEVPQYALELFAILQKAGRINESFAVLAKCRSQLESRLQNNHLDNDARQNLALCLAQEGNYQLAEMHLLEALRQSPGDPVTRNLLATVYARWAVLLPMENDQQDLVQQLDLLQKSIEADPQNPLAYQVILPLASRRPEGSQRMRQMVEESLVRGATPGIAHAVLGCLALIDEDYDTARREFQISNSSGFSSPLVLNNLAWVLTHQDVPDLDLALSIANEALALSPRDPRVLDTRGRIYIALEQWTEAVVDLEAALNEVRSSGHASLSKELHSVLAIAYKNLGQDRLSAAHSARAE